ncbi:MAG: hypothetical protein KBD66_02500 [Candidatus Doudnabacteria bacterium]|nr:hypothetical protein [Candidatus Doudnabacteria bacterium]
MSTFLSHIQNILRWPLLVFLLHILALYSGLYANIPKLDNLLHFLGGMSIAAAALSFIAFAKHVHVMEIHTWWLRIFLTLALVTLAAVAWECMEYILDHAIGSHMQGDVTDTMSDMVLALCGGGIVVILSKTLNQYAIHNN